MDEEKKEEIKKQIALKLKALTKNELITRMMGVLETTLGEEFFPPCWDVALDALFVEVLCDKIKADIEGSKSESYSRWKAEHYKEFQSAALRRHLEIGKKVY